MPRSLPAARASAALLWLAVLGALGALAGAATGAEAETPLAPEELLLLRPRPPPAPPSGASAGQAATGFVVAHFAHVQGGGGEGVDGLAGEKPLSRALRGLAAVSFLRELRLTLSRGRWDTSRWGPPPGSSQELPQSGAELWVEFHPGTNSSEADAAWGLLAEAVGGLLCTSLGTLGGPGGGQSVTPEGVWAGQAVRGRGPTRHGVIVGEPLCTENISPWLALLPCGDLRGLAAILRRPRAAQADFVMLGLSLKVRAGAGRQAEGPALEARQWATLVLRAGEWGPARGWSWDLQDVFGAHVLEPCPYCPLSKILVEVPVASLGSGGVLTTPSPAAAAAQPVVPGWTAQVPPTGAVHLEYFLQPGGLSLEQIWGPESLQPPAPAVPHGALMTTPHILRANQVLIGSGNRHAGIFYDISLGEKLQEGARLCMFQDFVESLQVALPEERGRPGHWKMCFREMQTPDSFQMEVEFDKAFITVEECTPDISRGLDIPAAVFSIAPAAGKEDIGATTLAFESAAAWPATAVTEQLLMSVAHPDMSMPFNVVSFTSTGLVLYLGVVTRSIVRGAESYHSARRDRQKKIASMVLFTSFLAATAAIGLYIDREAREQFGGFLRANGLPLADLLAPV